MSTLLQQLKQWPPTNSTVLGVALVLFGLDYALAGNFTQATSLAGLFAVFCPERAGIIGEIENAVGACGAGAKQAVLPLALAIGLASIGLSACSSTAQQDINAVLGNSIAAEAVSYVAALDPTVEADLADADAAIAADAPKVLAVACGAASMGNLIVGTVHAIDPKLVPDATYQTIEAGVAAIQPLCAPNGAPQNIAQAAQQALSAYSTIFQAMKSAGVTLPATAG